MVYIRVVLITSRLSLGVQRRMSSSKTWNDSDASMCVYVAALQVILCVGRDCLLAGDSCSSDETCSPRLRTLRQCVAGDGSVKLGPGARSQCANAVSALLSSPLHGCQCRRGMKREKNCLSIYWSLYQSGIHGERMIIANNLFSVTRITVIYCTSAQFTECFIV